MKKSKIFKIILKIVVSLGFISWIVVRTKWVEVFAYLRVVRLWQLMIYSLIILLGMIISSYKWKLLSDFKKINVSLKDHFRYYLTGTFINNFLPSFIGGDTFKAYQIGHKDKLYAQAASSVMADRITGLFGACILASIFSLINIDRVLDSRVLLLVNSFIIASLAFDIIASKFRDLPVWKRFFKYVPEKIMKLLRELGSYNDNSRIIMKAIWLSFVFNFFGVALANYILFWSLGIKLPIIDYLSVIFLINIVASIPISINNYGIKEWAYITFFGVLGVGSSVAITVAILGRFIQMIISFSALPIYLKNRK
jgi:glycosyltransferase 2 family protein